MSNILLVEPNYRAKFPPLGLLRLASYHRSVGDNVTFTRGRDEGLRSLRWHRIYVSSLFTYELPRTVKTLRFYRSAVDKADDLIVGGIGATLMSDFIKDSVECRVIVGPLYRSRMIGEEPKPIAKYLPDYSIIDMQKWDYLPKDSYFCRITIGCIRHCKFCAVPQLEPKFAYFQSLRKQLKDVDVSFGERQHLVLLDNNILACSDFERVVKDIYSLGFPAGAVRNGRQRTVDFNQGIDARLITKKIASLLSSIAISPVRLAFDHRAIESAYVRAIKALTNSGLSEFTNYVMYNFNDDPADFYHRIRLNAELSEDLNVRVTGFPMRYRTITDTSRRYVAPNWKWRYLRGIQCVLLATHGLVSPKLRFFDAAFGANVEEFLEILSMPDRYIIYRKKYENNGANEWLKAFRKLSDASREEFLEALAVINRSRNKPKTIVEYKQFSRLLQHYYPGGKPVPCS